MATRLPTEASDLVRELAEERDWSYSETLAALVAIGLDHTSELAPSNRPEELPLTKAS